MFSGVFDDDDDDDDGCGCGVDVGDDGGYGSVRDERDVGGESGRRYGDDDDDGARLSNVLVFGRQQRHLCQLLLYCYCFYYLHRPTRR